MSPTLIILSLTLLKYISSTITFDPEKSIASFPMFSKLALLMTPLLKSKSIASESFSVNLTSEILKEESNTLIASSELISLKVIFDSSNLVL